LLKSGGQVRCYTLRNHYKELEGAYVHATKKIIAEDSASREKNLVWGLVQNTNFFKMKSRRRVNVG
jgi:hypothetical protein